MKILHFFSSGDHVSIDGVYLPIQKSGFAGMAQGLLSETFMEAHRVVTINKTEDEEMLVDDEISQEELRQLQQASTSSVSPGS